MNITEAKALAEELNEKHEMRTAEWGTGPSVLFEASFGHDGSPVVFEHNEFTGEARIAFKAPSRQAHF